MLFSFPLRGSTISCPLCSTRTSISTMLWERLEKLTPGDIDWRVFSRLLCPVFRDYLPLFPRPVYLISRLRVQFAFPTDDLKSRFALFFPTPLSYATLFFIREPSFVTLIEYPHNSWLSFSLCLFSRFFFLWSIFRALRFPVSTAKLEASLSRYRLVGLANPHSRFGLGVFSPSLR